MRFCARSAATLRAMDRVRFGRALGYGARHAAKALMQAADAATAPSEPRPAAAVSPISRPIPGAPETNAKRKQTATAARAKQATKNSFLHPVKRYSGTVLLQVVGTFFAVFALLMAQTTWKLRAGFTQKWNTPEAGHAWLTAGLFLLFAWFAVSSFLRARRLERS